MWKKTPWWTYSLNDESSFMPFQYASKEDALKAAMEDAEIDKAERVYIGRINEYIPTVDAADVIDQIRLDEANEAKKADTKLPFDLIDNATVDDIYELEEMLTNAYRKWEDKHGYTSGVYKITDIEEFQVRGGDNIDGVNVGKPV